MSPRLVRSHSCPLISLITAGFEQRLLDAEGSESDISEFEGPSKKSKKQSKALKGQKPKEKGGNSRKKHAKSRRAESISQDEEWEEADENDDLEFGDDQDDDQANEAGRSNIFEQVDFNCRNYIRKLIRCSNLQRHHRQHRSRSSGWTTRTNNRSSRPSVTRSTSIDPG